MLEEIKEEYVFQYPLYNEWYFLIADFYLPKRKLLLEVDGSYHENEKKREQERKRKIWLNSLGYEVIRIKNKDVYKLNHKKLKELLKNK